MAANKRKILEAARKYAQKGARDRALKEYEKLLKLDPRDAKLRLEVGDAHRRWGQVEEAIACYSRVAEQYTDDGFDARGVAVYKQIHNLDPERYDSYEPLAELYQRMGLVSEAISALQTAADGYHREGRKREALGLLRKMAALDPTDTNARIKVAELLRQEHLVEEAVAELDEAVKELEQQREKEAVGTVYKRILEIAPDRVSTMIDFARHLLARGLAERAEPFAKRAVEAEPQDPELHELLAEIYGALKREHELIDVYRNLAEIYRARGDEERAIDIQQRFVPPDEFSPATDSPVAKVEETLIDPALPEEESEFLDEADLDLPRLFDPAAREREATAAPPLETDIGSEGEEAAEPLLLEDEFLDASMPEPPQASRASEAEPSPATSEEVSPSPGDPEQLLAEASVYLRYGKREQAIANLEGILADDPTHRSALEKLGESYAEGGDSARAVELWLRAAERAGEDDDSASFAVLRDRIAALDEVAAATPSPGAGDAPSEAPPGPEMLGTVPVLDDIEIDIDEASFRDEEEPPQLEFEEPAEPPAEPSETPPPAEEAARASDASLSTPQQIAEELEEAEFYFQQGLTAEAEAIYQRLLEAAPNHPRVLARLAEIAAARGEDTAVTRADPTPAEPPSLVSANLGEAAPGDELDGEGVRSDGEEETPSEDRAPALEVTVPNFELGVDVERGAESIEPEDEDVPSLEPLEPESARTTSDERALADLDLDDEPLAAAAPDDAPSAAAEALAESTARVLEGAGEPGFDLAAELNQALDEQSDADSSALLGDTADDGFAAVFSEFKKGVKRTLQEGDHEAHYDLGIAYREMGLLDDAIGEFRAATTSAERRVDGFHLMGLCAFELERPQEAVGYLELALGSEEVTDEQQLAVRFALGQAFEGLGDVAAAREAYAAVAAIDPSFCEVEARLEGLDAEGEEPRELEEAAGPADEGRGEEPGALEGDGDSGAGADPGDEPHESFEDLIAEANADLEPEEGEETSEASQEDAGSESRAEVDPAPETESAPKPSRKRKKISFV